MKLLSGEDIEDLNLELSTIFFYRDRAMKDYHFFKLDIETRKALAEPPENTKPTPDQEISQAARVVWFSEYNMPHLQHRIPADAAQELLADYQAGRLPKWANKAIRIREIRTAARG